MTDEDKALLERVAMLPDGNAWPSTVELLCDLRDRIEAQAAEIEKLRGAGTKLRGYAEHDDSCSSVQRWQTSPCNCGYIDAWKQWDAALEARND